MMRRLRQQAGMTLIEMTIFVAIAAVIMVPLGSIAINQITVPKRLSERSVASSQQKSISVRLVEDILTAQRFEPGADPVYGTFSWAELGDDKPVPVEARYFWAEGNMFREQTRGGTTGASQRVIESVDEFGDIVFEHTPSQWVYSDSTKTWSYTRGKIGVSLTVTRETGAKLAEVELGSALFLNVPQPNRA